MCEQHTKFHFSTLNFLQCHELTALITVLSRGLALMVVVHVRACSRHYRVHREVYVQRICHWIVRAQSDNIAQYLLAV